MTPKRILPVTAYTRIYEETVPDAFILFSQLKKICSLDDYSVYLDLSTSDALIKNEYFLIIMGGGITGDIQVNDTDLHHTLKTIYCNKESELVVDKSATDRTKIPTPTRDNVMYMLCSAWSKTTSDFDMELAFKQNAISINLDGSEDHLVKTGLFTLVMEEIK